MKTEKQMMEMLEEIAILDAVVEMGVAAQEKKKKIRLELAKIMEAYAETVQEIF